MTGKTNITEHSEVVQRIKTHAHLMITTNINNNGSLATYTTTRENSMDSDKNVRLSIAKIIRKIYKGTEKDQSQVGHSSSSRSLLASAVMKITHSKKVNRQQHMVHQIDEDVVEPSLLPSTFQESGSSCVSSTIVIPIAQPPIHPVSSESESTVSLIDEDQIEFIPSTFSSPASSFTSHSSDHNDLSVHLLEEESVEQKIECSIPRFYFPNSNNCVFNQSPSSDSFVSRFPEMTSFFSRYPSDEGVPLMLFMTVCKEWFNFPSFCALPLAKRIHKVYGHYGNHRVANFGNKGLKNKKSLPGSTQVSMSTSRSFIERRSSLVGTSKDSSSSSSDSDRHIDGLLQDKDSATSSPFNLSSDTDDDGENFKSVVIEVQEEHNGVTKVSRRYKQLPLEQHKYDLATISNDSFEMDEHPQKKPSENELDLLDGTGVHVRFAPFAKYWKKEIEPCDATERMFNLIKQPNNDVIYPNDLYPFVFQLVQLHPGLAVLRGGNSGSNATSVTVFQHDYIVTSIVRYFYTVNRSRTGKINRGEFRRGNLLTVWKFLDNEDDIEQELHYFSYEEFYYLYCSFQDLDTDQDGVLTENDLKRYAGGVLTQEVIDRVFSVGERALSDGYHGFKTNSTMSPATCEGMSYVDFIYFTLAFVDNSSRMSRKYWFRCLDIEDKGYLDVKVLQYWYSVQAKCLRNGIANPPDPPMDFLSFDDFLSNWMDCYHVALSPLMDDCKTFGNSRNQSWRIKEEFFCEFVGAGSLIDVLLHNGKFRQYQNGTFDFSKSSNN